VECWIDVGDVDNNTGSPNTYTIKNSRSYMGIDCRALVYDVIIRLLLEFIEDSASPFNPVRLNPSTHLI